LSLRTKCKIPARKDLQVQIALCDSKRAARLGVDAMRRIDLGLVVVIALLGGCAQGAPGTRADTAETIRRIEAFVAAQKESDSRACTAQGFTTSTPDHTACIHDLAAKRRAAIEGAASASRPPADPSIPSRDI
jgi:hypothetical protein